MLWQANELTYCLNVHPGESLSDVCNAISGPVREVKQRLCPNAPFGLGLRLSANAVTELREPSKIDELRALLAASGMYAFTVNGFPYGTFHGAPVKDRVYLPDWSTPERHQYTSELARVMTQLAPPRTKATISTLPLGYRLHGDTDVRRAVCSSVLLRQVVELWQLRQETGVEVALALEPEPHCLLETTEDVLLFFQKHMHTDASVGWIAQACGVGKERALDILRDHLGICLDTCHAAVEYEEPGALLAQLAQANVGVKKVQVSSGLRIARATEDACAQLKKFDEPIYLHQVVAKQADGPLRRYADIGDALADPDARGLEWRIHFHVPVHESRLAVFESTQAFTAEVLKRQRESSFCDHWEIETYTWNVLPTKPVSLVDSICLEFAWVQGLL